MILANETEGAILRSLVADASTTIFKNLLMLRVSVDLFNMAEVYFVELVSFMETTFAGITAINGTFESVPMGVIVKPAFLKKMNLIAKSLLYAVLKSKNGFLKISERFHLGPTTEWKTLFDVFDASEFAVEAIVQQVSKMLPKPLQSANH